jgi:Phosphatidylinositol-4-phosphate 5-Kinase
MFKSPDGT